MNPFERARLEAIRVRSELLKHCTNKHPNSTELLVSVESALLLAIEIVPSGFAALGGAIAVLKRDECSIYVRNDIPPPELAYLVAHELGHFILDADKDEPTIASLASLTKSDGTPATLKVEAYGVHERQELQANVFARELLMPRALAKQLWTESKGPTKIATDFLIPLEIVRQQMLDAVLLPVFPPAPPSVLPTPSPDQIAAATAPERYVNVVAGPGTGKTTTLVQRVKHLVDTEGVSPSKILVLTFTNKAAFELVERLRLSGLNAASSIWAGTFHAFGLEFFRKYHQLFKLESEIAVADTLQEISLLVRSLPKLTLQFYQRLQDPYDWLKDVISCIHRLKEELVTPEQFRQRISDFPDLSDEVQKQRHDIAELYSALEVALNEAQMVSMSDLVMRTAIKLRDDRSEVAQFANQFEHILVDEYQDVSEAMVVLVRQIALKSKSLWVVGDVRQAIHHWRGASVKSLLRFEQSFKSDQSQTARKYPLDSNRRSSAEIVKLFSHAGTLHVLEQYLPLDQLTATKGASGIIPELLSCSTKSAIANGIRDRINMDKGAGIEYRDQAVLCRRAADVDVIATFLRDSGVPVFHIGDVMRRVEVKRFLCLMQLLVEREPKALVGLTTEPAYSLPIVDIHCLINYSRQNMEFQRGRWLGKKVQGLSPSGINAAAAIAQLLKGLSRSSSPWAFLCHLMLELRFGLPNDNDVSIDAQTQRIALWQFAYSIRNGDGDARRMNLSRYLSRQQLRQRIGETYGDKQLPAEASFMNAVRIMTVHGSKGLEFESVHVGYVDDASYGAAKPTWNLPGGVEEILSPEILGSTATEFDFENAVERNNLLYVALSRAKTRLHLYESVEFGTKDRPLQLQRLPAEFCKMLPYGLPQAKQTTRLFVPAAAQSSISFDDFETYVRCPRQYYYRHKLVLTSELELDVSARAKRAINQALISFAKGGNAQVCFDTAWSNNRLPVHAEDPGLFCDAVSVCNQGMSLVSSLGGRIIEGGMARLAGLYVQLPWIVHSPQAGNHLIRITSYGATKTKDLLRPLILDAPTLPRTSFTVRTLLMPREIDVPISKAPEKTAAYKACLGILAEDYTPNPSAVCGRCAFSTICPGFPVV
ncbi:UvrD-helicase domain-containing protein [Janthinobacterium sp. UMAB-56]|uniref:UvrD-helicase domain-containing protein n=1 Tax=Janthinobacterium sp. UMAB-56 TaxID=1365361 RepID=UPI001C59D840|nr:UvrD-helicase domain-containing protein [Janthinobacterium sp. UMAB-56]